ncbi:MAG: hypothetical protein WB998_08945 [Solirubrobacteraceae bacterium]
MTERTASRMRRVPVGKRLAGAGLCLATVLAGALGSVAQPAGANRPAATMTSRTLNATDTAHLHYVSGSGAELFEEGSASGSLPGKMEVHGEVGPTLSAGFKVFLHGGTIVGRGTAKAHGAGRYESFAGSLTVTGGTGRYAHAHGHAGLYGVFDRRTYAMTVQTTGRLLY